MTNMLRRSLSIEIVDFIKNVNNKNIKNFTKSAFIQQRKKIRPEVFKELSNTLIKEFYTDNDLSIKLWNGYRVLSIDGSIITLPNTKELSLEYGKQINNTTVEIVQARASVMYDVLNELVIDSELSPLKIGERILAKKHLKKAIINDLIIYDRGYPSFELVYEHNRLNIQFLMRVKTNYNKQIKNFVESKKKNQIIELRPDPKNNFKTKNFEKESRITVRLVRVKLANGKEEILMTTLLNSKKYTIKMFKELYFKRWGVETYYDELKNKLKVEFFSGYSSMTIQQDFNVSIFISNIQSLFTNEIKEEIEEITKERQYKYRLNKNMSYGLLKNRIINLFNEDESVEITEELKELFRTYLVPIRPNRNNKRHMNKYRTKRKPKVIKNLKDAI